MPVAACTAGHAAALQEQQEAILAKELRSLTRRYPDIPLQQVASQGEPADALAPAATDAQLLVVGSHGRGGFLATSWVPPRVRCCKRRLAR